MAKPAFDTLGAARELEAKGFPPDRAGAIVNTIQRSKSDLVTSELFETRTAETRTYVDGRFAEMQANSDRRFAELRAHIDAGLAAQEAKLYRALWLQGGAIVGVLTGLVGLAAGLQTILGGG